MNVKKFEKDFLKCFKKLKINKNKNIYVTSNLSNISSIRIRKQEKLNSIYSCLTNSMGKIFQYLYLAQH